jgi:uncharacterized membrane protein SirB2
MSDIASLYPHIKGVHITLVLASGLLFAVRGALMLAGRSWAMARPWRLSSYMVDTLLLAAGVTLWAILSIDPVSSPWLGVKLMLLVVYIVLGSLALKRARSATARRISYTGAIAVYLLMVSVAITHDPLGPMRMLAADAV